MGTSFTDRVVTGIRVLASRYEDSYTYDFHAHNMYDGESTGKILLFTLNGYDSNSMLYMESVVVPPEDNSRSYITSRHIGTDRVSMDNSSNARLRHVVSEDGSVYLLIIGRDVNTLSISTYVRVTR